MYFNNEPDTTTTAPSGGRSSTNFYQILERKHHNNSAISKNILTTTLSPPDSGNHSTTVQHSGANDVSSKRPAIVLYPTVAPESIVIPIVSCIFGFPLLALLVICCLRRRAKLARERDRRRNYDLQDHAVVSLVRFSPIHRFTGRSTRTVSLRSERSMSRGFPSLELDTVMEERSDPEQTQIDLITPDSPLHPSNEQLNFDADSS